VMWREAAYWIAADNLLTDRGRSPSEPACHLDCAHQPLNCAISNFDSSGFPPVFPVCQYL
jgi:hypothetical protein